MREEAQNLFNELKSYIDNLENSLLEKDKEIEFRNNRIKELSDIIKENRGLANNFQINDEKFISLDKDIFDVKSIYYLILKATESKKIDNIKKLFNLLDINESKKLGEKVCKDFIEALNIYRLYSLDDDNTKREFLIKSLEKLNPEKLSKIESEVFNNILNRYEILAYIDEDFLIKFARQNAFSGNKEIAKKIIRYIIENNRVIEKYSNRENIMLIGLHIGIERVRKLSFIELIYIKAMDSEFDNHFINFLMGNTNLTEDYFKKNAQKIRVLNNNLVQYIYSLISERGEEIIYKPSLELKQPKKEIEVIKKETNIKTPKVALKSIYINRNTKICDDDSSILRTRLENLNYYDLTGKTKLGEVNEYILYCPKCKKKSVNADIIRKIYKRLDHNYRLKFLNVDLKNQSTSLNLFGYNVGVPRRDRVALLKEVIIPALGVKKVIEDLNYLIYLHENNKGKDFSNSLIEWRNDINEIKKNYN